ncbi:MAG: hypothetical protein LRY62_02515, partial [Alphaproteobacteria bacterium]|nr:hypothetical protein [Alphaproteobacteria bacterium]
DRFPVSFFRQTQYTGTSPERHASAAKLQPIARLRIAPIEETSPANGRLFLQILLDALKDAKG